MKKQKFKSLAFTDLEFFFFSRWVGKFPLDSMPSMLRPLLLYPLPSFSVIALL